MNYHNSSFADDMQKEFHKYTNLCYVIEVDEDNDDIVSLIIQSTSMSELNGSEEGDLGDYSYTERQEALDDLKQACNEYKVDFEDPETDINFYSTKT